jgi:lipoprotein-anchoring transpeptidase ErfK/SrfK
MLSMRARSFLYILIFSVLGFGFLSIYLSMQKPFCANSVSCKESFNLKVENGVSGVFDGQVVIPPKIDLAKKETSTKVLGEATVVGEKHIYVDLTNQTLTAYQGETVFLQTQISSGKWHPTPTGDFKIWEKVQATRMTGGEGADYYDLPNVPYVMFFGGGNVPDGAGFGLHGTYWHDNFGHPMSHGCVNMRTMDAEKLYGWADVGTPITIYGQAPL